MAGSSSARRPGGSRPAPEPAAEDEPGTEAEPPEAELAEADEPADERPGRRRFEGTPLDSGAGFVLGLLAWGWIGLPLLTGGPAGVKKVLKAKFFNKAPDGSWLP